LVTQRGVDGKTEKDLVVNVNVLFKWLVGVQACQFTLYDGLGSFSRSIYEVIVNFGDSAILLHSLHKVLSWEILHHLEFLVPVAKSLGVKTVERN